MNGLETESLYVLCPQYKAFPRADRVWEAVHRFGAQQWQPSGAGGGPGARQAFVELFATMPRPFGATGGPPRALLCAPDALPPCLVRTAPPDAAALPPPMAEPLVFGARARLVTLYRDYALTIVCDLQPSVGALDPATMRFHYDTLADTLERAVAALAAPCTFTVSGVTWRVCSFFPAPVHIFFHVSVCTFACVCTVYVLCNVLCVCRCPCACVQQRLFFPKTAIINQQRQTSTTLTKQQPTSTTNSSAQTYS